MKFSPGRIFLSCVVVLSGGAASLSCAAQPAAGVEPMLMLAQNADIDIKNRSDGEETEQRRRARIRMELAVNYYQGGRLDIALDELKQSLTIDPNYVDAMGVLAMVYMELGEKALSEQSFKRAMQLKPNDSDLNNNYGWFLCANGRESESIPYFLEALKNRLFQRPALALQNAGVCSLRLGDKAGAEGYLMRSFELDPGAPVTATNLARIFYERNELDRARFYVGGVNKTDAASPESLWLAIRIEHKLRNNTEESSLGARLRRQFPNARETAAYGRGAYDE